MAGSSQGPGDNLLLVDGILLKIDFDPAMQAMVSVAAVVAAVELLSRGILFVLGHIQGEDYYGDYMRRWRYRGSQKGRNDREMWRLHNTREGRMEMEERRERYRNGDEDPDPHGLSIDVTKDLEIRSRGVKGWR